MRALLKTTMVAAAISIAAGCSTVDDTATTASSDLNSKIAELEAQKSADASTIAALQSRLSSSNSAGASTALLPPNAQPGRCYARVLTPATYKTEYETVLTKGEGETVKVIPATYRNETQKLLVKEASEKIVVVSPAKYQTQTEKVLVRPAYKTWKKGRGPIEKIDSSTGEIMCLVEVPAQYKTITKRVMVAPPVTKKVVIPAQYKTITRNVVDRPAQVVSSKIPAQYGKVAKRIKVGDASLEWREILCKTNTTPDVVRRLQSNLRSKGFNPGPIDGVIGSQTMGAVRAFQRSKGLPVGQLTIGTLNALGM